MALFRSLPMTTEQTQHKPPAPSANTSEGSFRTTRWTQVGRAKAESADGRRALAELCDAYYEPVAAFLRSELRDADAARDMAHDFFAGVLGFLTFISEPVATRILGLLWLPAVWVATG